MITIVDYQMGNLRSVQKAIEKLGFDAEISSDAATIASAQRLILPGVGGLADAVAELRRRDLVGSIRDFIGTGRPFLGICLGLQMLFERGFEGVPQDVDPDTWEGHETLGILAGDVVRFALPPSEYKVPHMGWNSIHKQTQTVLLEGIADRTQFYFVHSYYVRPSDDSVVAATCEYGTPFCAMVSRENLFATQFHPEKSQRDGLRLLKNFATTPLQYVASTVDRAATI
ncbi:MAG: imidazole glycerol phosphate synthase subunit HisH [Planctomycetota bacterium]